MEKVHKFVKTPDFIVAVIVAAVALLIIYFVIAVCGILIGLDFLIAAAIAFGLSLMVYNWIGKRGGWYIALSSIVAGIVSAVICPVLQVLIISPCIYYPLRQMFVQTPFDDVENLIQMGYEFYFCGIIGLIIGAAGLPFITYLKRQRPD